MPDSEGQKHVSAWSLTEIVLKILEQTEDRVNQRMSVLSMLHLWGFSTETQSTHQLLSIPKRSVIKRTFFKKKECKNQIHKHVYTLATRITSAMQGLWLSPLCS